MNPAGEQRVTCTLVGPEAEIERYLDRITDRYNPCVEFMPSLFIVDLVEIYNAVGTKYSRHLEDWFPADYSEKDDLPLPEVLELVKQLTKGSVVNIKWGYHCGMGTFFDPYSDEIEFPEFVLFDGQTLTDESYIFHCDDEGPFGSVYLYDESRLISRADARWEQQAEEAHRKEIEEADADD